MELVLAGAVENRVLHLFGQLLVGRFHRNAVVLGQRLEIHRGDGALASAVPAHHVDAALRERELSIGNHKVGIDLQQGAEARACRTCAEGIVERKHARRELFDADAAIRAGVVLRKEHLFAVHHRDDREPVAETERGLKRVRQAAFDAGLDHNAVDDRLDGVLKLFIQRGCIRNVVDRAVHAHANIALALELVEELLVLTFSAADAGRDDLRLGVLRQRHHAIDHLIDGLLFDGLSAIRAMRHTAARVEQTQIVVNLRDRTHRTARVMARALLID